MIAIALHTGGALGKLFSEVAENADLKPIEGLQSVGAQTGRSGCWLGVIPQVAPNWLSYALLRFEINVRASAILGFVGEGGIGHDLKLAMQWGQGRYDKVVAIFLLLFAAIVVIDQLSDHFRDRLVKGRTMTTAMSPTLADTVTRSFDAKRRMAIAIPLLILAYLTYAAISFDMRGLGAPRQFRQRGHPAVRFLVAQDACHPRQPLGRCDGRDRGRKEGHLPRRYRCPTGSDWRARSPPSTLGAGIW